MDESAYRALMDQTECGVAAQLALLPGGHYTAYLDGEERAAQVLVSFLDSELRTTARPPADPQSS